MSLRISQKLEYAMRAMIELALRGEAEETLVPAREIAEAQDIPLRFLEQQLGALHKAGLVESFRGAGGGCRLARAAEDIRVADIADAIEGQLFPMFCLEPTDHTCIQDARCACSASATAKATLRPTSSCLRSARSPSPPSSNHVACMRRKIEGFGAERRQICGARLGS